jgi:hypothetical protein
MHVLPATLALAAYVPITGVFRQSHLSITTHSGHFRSSDNRGLPVLQCSAFGLQALQDIEPRQRPTGLLDQPTIAQIA